MAEQVLDWTDSFKDSFFDVDLQEVSGPGSAVGEAIAGVDLAASELSLDGTETDIDGLDL